MMQIKKMLSLLKKINIFQIMLKKKISNSLKMKKKDKLSEECLMEKMRWRPKYKNPNLYIRLLYKIRNCYCKILKNLSLYLAA